MTNEIETRRDFARIVNACLSAYSAPELTAQELRTWFRALAELSLVGVAAALFAHMGNPSARGRAPTPDDVLRIAQGAA